MYSNDYSSNKLKKNYLFIYYQPLLNSKSKIMTCKSILSAASRAKASKAKGCVMDIFINSFSDPLITMLQICR